MKALGIIYNDYFLFSRAIHDFRWLDEDKEIAIDGGQPYQSGYLKIIGNDLDKIKTAWAEIPFSSSESYEDWRFAKDKIGKHRLDEIKIIDSVDTESMEYKAEHCLWKNIEGKVRNLCELETDYLENILEHLGIDFNDYRINIINYLLENRK